MVAVVAHTRLPIRGKLFVAFGAVVTLLVTTAALGVSVLGQSNARTETLATLQRRVSVYRQLRSDTTFKLYVGAAASADMEPDALDTAVRQLNESYDFERLQFLAEDEGDRLRAIQSAYEQFVSLMTDALTLQRNGALTEGQEVQRVQARPIADTLVRLTDELVNKAESDIATLVDQNQKSHRSSRRFFVTAATGGVGLALILGFAISLSIIGPVTKMNRRLAQLASGDFASRVEIPNRDELGELAANLNAMSEELGRLYSELAEWNRSLESRVADQVRELRDSRARVVAAADAARRQIERDLHDGAQQDLVALLATLRFARDLVAQNSAAALEILGDLATGLKAAINALRDLAHGVYPPLLVEAGLPEALQSAVAANPADVRVVADGIGRYASEIEEAVYFCCLEALQNVAKHAPEAHATLCLHEDGGLLSFDMTDDGPGLGSGVGVKGQGFANMSDRLGAVGGKVHWESTAGRGTRVSGSVPLCEDRAPTVESAAHSKDA